MLPDKWKGGLKPVPGQLTGFMGHSIWPLGMIHLPFTLTNHEKNRRNTALIDFVVVRHSSKHNVILGRKTLLRFRGMSFNIHGVLKFGSSQGSGIVLATPPQVLKRYEIM